LSRHINANYPESEGSRPLLASTLKDYDYLIDETRENAAQLQSLLQNYTSLQAIKESQKGLEQADVVRKYVPPC
jgi:5-bromo-4-chloroindolyl phosphate hydrolysis protein